MDWQARRPAGKLRDPTGKLRDPLGKLVLSLGKLVLSLGKLPDPLGKLPDPTGKLPDPTGKLHPPLGKLRDPLGELPDPTGKLRDPLGELPDPAGKLRDPLGKLPAWFGELPDPLDLVQPRHQALAAGQQPGPALERARPAAPEGARPGALLVRGQSGFTSPLARAIRVEYKKLLLGMHRLLHILVACTALAVALLAPLRVSAAILPACEDREVATLAPPPPSAAEEAPREAAACATASDEPDANARFAPMCDLRGASAIAPPHIHPIGDDRIEAVPSCEHDLLSPTSVGPRHPDPLTAPPGAALAEHATLSALPLVPPPPSEEAPAYPPVLGEPSRGVERGVYHPPR